MGLPDSYNAMISLTSLPNPQLIELLVITDSKNRDGVAALQVAKYKTEGDARLTS